GTRAAWKYRAGAGWRSITAIPFARSSPEPRDGSQRHERNGAGRSADSGPVRCAGLALRRGPARLPAPILHLGSVRNDSRRPVADSSTDELGARVLLRRLFAA